MSRSRFGPEPGPARSAAQVPDGPRYSFHPLERRGVVLGLQPGQLATMGAGVILALVVHAAAGGPAGAPLAFLVGAAAVAGAVWTRDGRPLVAWAVLGLSWLHRRGRQPRLSPLPLDGTAVRAAGSGLLPTGVSLLEYGSAGGFGRFGVIKDRTVGTWAAVVPVRGRSLSLLDPGEQAQRLEAWRAVLAAVARPASPVRRVQWVLRSGPNSHQPQPAFAPPGEARSPVGDARSSYQRFVGVVAPSAQCHDTWLVLAVDGDRRSRGDTPMAVLAREMRFLTGQLRQADLDAGSPLAMADLGRLIGSRAMAARETWSSLQVDDGWHATYWVAEWPRVEVGPGFMVPLLMSRGRQAVSVVMSPVGTDRAIREARSARTADLADDQLRNRAGFLSSARRDREAEGALRREEELAEGHAEYRYSGYVTVSADDEEGLAGACAELEHAAQSARVELRRLFGRQAEAFWWTAPLARGLR